jgi:hypothetical protein
MRTLIYAGAAAVLLAGVGAAVADEVVVTPEQQTVIREYVHKKPLASISLPGVELNIGSRLPDTVELHTLDVPDVHYQYTVIDGQTVLVDPNTHAIVQVIQ